MDFDIKHDKDNQCFFIEISGQMAELNYKKRGENTLEYYKTFVPEPLRGQGIAGKITRHALDFARKNHFSIIPSCSYVKKYIDAHPEYADLVK